MKNLSLTLTMVLCVLIMQAQMSNADQPEQDSLRLSETQTINLNQGWSGISSYLDPTDPTVATLMAAIEEQLIIIKDFDGNSYQPSGKNTLVDWDFKQGYFIKMGSQETLEIAGLYPLSKQLDLQTGWNMIPVLSDVPVDIEDYFYDNLDKVEIVTEVAGLQVFWPGLEIFTLDQVAPGKGYLVKTLAPFSLYQLPEVITAPVTEIAGTSATCGGEVIVEGSSSVTSRGLVWSTSVNPTVGENEGITCDGQGTGSWVGYLSGLDPQTTYFIRAYATNHVGTTYGTELSFTTQQASFLCGTSTVTDIEGNTYSTVLVNEQCWMAENLKTTKYRDGTSIDFPGENQLEWETNTTGAYAWYDNDISWKDIYGALYNWHAVANPKGLCPEGWHEPTENEWWELEDFIWSVNPVGTGSQLKSCRQVNSPLGGDCDVEEHPRWDEYQWIWGTDDYGFAGLPAGSRDWSWNEYWGMGYFCTWWSSTEMDDDWAYVMMLTIDWEDTEIYDDIKNMGYSVRCIRDEPGSAYIPEITTTDLYQITANSAKSGGVVLSDGGSPVTTRGIVFSQSENPTITNYEGITENGSGTGSFESVLSGLSPETVYYLRAFATNDMGTAYGEQLDFVTLNTDWDEPVVTIYNSPEAEIVHRTGDIDNLGYGWPYGFDPFSGASTPMHAFPFFPEPDDPDGTDRIMVISGFEYGSGNYTDGYTIVSSRPDNLPVPINITFDLQSVEIGNIVIQMFLDDFQAGIFGPNYYQVKIDNERIPILEQVINALNQSGPIGKLVTVQIPEAYNYLFEDGSISLLFDDPVNNVGDGFAIDFVRLLINPDNISNTGTIQGFVEDNDNNPVEGVTVTASNLVSAITDNTGYYALPDVPAGMVYVNASKNGYVSSSVINELLAGTTENLHFVLSQSLQCPGTPTVTDIDGNVYNTVLIGDQCWMAENLNTECADSWCYTNDPENCETFGRLYNHNAANQVCPDGWHLPNNDDWCQLAIYLDETVNCADWGNLGTVVGGKMKSTGTLNTGGLWWEPNTGATNESGFSGLPGGFYHDGGFGDLSAAGRFWSATSSGTDWFFYWILGFDHAQIVKAEEHFALGFSVRCVRDN